MKSGTGGTRHSIWQKEIDILFGAICDGLRQEDRHRALLSLMTNGDYVPVSQFREVHLTAAIATQLRGVGFWIDQETDFYQARGPRPDAAIYLPASDRYMFLECKIVGPYNGFKGALADIDKLDRMNGPKDRYNSLLCVGFREPVERTDRFEEKYRRMDNTITESAPYSSRIQKVEMVESYEAIYAMVGLWVRKARTKARTRSKAA